ncbi:MAG TPA: hypothetical protein DCQ15_10720 [Chitinophagaceae bacterium]|nr:hypothetical protein [Chitinophagaceae bacterium]
MKFKLFILNILIVINAIVLYILFIFTIAGEISLSTIKGRIVNFSEILLFFIFLSLFVQIKIYNQIVFLSISLFLPLKYATIIDKGNFIECKTYFLAFKLNEQIFFKSESLQLISDSSTQILSNKYSSFRISLNEKEIVELSQKLSNMGFKIL